jgi:hypothetical protein
MQRSCTPERRVRYPSTGGIQCEHRSAPDGARTTYLDVILHCIEVESLERSSVIEVIAHRVGCASVLAKRVEVQACQATRMCSNYASALLFACERAASEICSHYGNAQIFPIDLVSWRCC